MKKKTDPRYLTKRQLCHWLRVSRNTFTRSVEPDLNMVQCRDAMTREVLYTWRALVVALERVSGAAYGGLFNRPTLADRWYTAEQAGVLLGVSKSAVLRWIHSPTIPIRLPAYRFGKTCIRILESDLRGWVEIAERGMSVKGIAERAGVCFAAHDALKRRKLAKWLKKGA